MMLENLIGVAESVSTAWVTGFGPLAWKAAVVLLATAVTCWWLWRASASTRHLIWTLSMGVVLLLPVLGNLLPAWEMDALPAAQPQVTAVPTTVEDPGAAMVPRPIESTPASLVTSEVTWRAPALWAFFAWETGLVLAFLWFGFGLTQLGSLRRRSTVLDDPVWSSQLDAARRRLGLRRPVVLLRGDRSTGPVTWGLRTPVLLLPAQCEHWDHAKREHVLLHELAHIQRRDFLTQLLAQAVCALHWFNPLVWVAARQMRLERERACDDHVLAHGARPSTYAGDLLELSTSLRAGAGAALSMASSSRLADRVQAVLDPHRNRRAPSRRTAALALAAILAIALPLAAVTADAEPQARDPQSTEGSEAAVAIEAQNERFMRAVEDQDLEAIGNLYVEDAEVYPPTGQALRGRNRILDYFEDAFDTGLAGEIRLRTDEVLQSGDTAVESGRFRSYDSRGDAVARGRYMAIWAKESDGEWRVRRDIANFELDRGIASSRSSGTVR